MELPECNSTYWKSKFIDGLPTLFAERVRKAIRGDNHSINYDDYTYGKLISAYVQEGEFCEQFAFDIPKQKSKDKDTPHKKKKSLMKDYEKWKKKRIEKKLRRAEEGKGDSSKRKKKYCQNYNKSDTCHKCGRFGHYAKDCRVKEKIKSLDIEDNLKDSLYKIMLNSDSGTEYSSGEESSTSEDLKALQQEDYMTSKEECSPCQQGMACEKDDNEEDDLYKIYDQFKEMSLNVIDNDKVIELLQNIKDPEIRAQIIDKISDSKEKDHIEKDYTPKEIQTKEGSYTMAKVKNLLLERRKMISYPTTINDLKEEINNLKEDITRLKEKNVVIEVRLDAIQTLQNLGNASHSSSSFEGENNIKNITNQIILGVPFINDIFPLTYWDNNKIIGTWNNKPFILEFVTKPFTRMINDLTAKLLVSKNNQISFIKQEINSIEVDPASSSGTNGISINHSMYKEFMDFMKSKKESDNNPPPYSSILMDDENIEVFDMNDKKEVILLLEENDRKWRNEPWQIMARYLDTVSYTTTVYKYRMHYEIILSSTWCKFQHFYPANTKKITVKYNYWDYIDGFNKVLLYENANRKHSWFIKICSNIFDRHIPNWFCKWWTLYGPSVKILPESYKKLYLEWVDISPKLINLQEENIFFEGISLMYFFIEFSIPWIMKWSIEVNNTSEGFPCLQKTFYTKFWSKLLQRNPEGQMHGKEIIDLINVISKYYDTATSEPQVIEELNPFKKITRKLQMKKGLISKSEAIALYMEEVIKYLMRNLDIDIKDDISMASASHTNEEDDTCIVGEGQDFDEEIDIETILKRYQ
ncbi:hypothetical protein H5410_051358 [Solanum commersonii]|uniref:CCHC-type domain-containing protein n=1 Tax=Solanum commersonii TaxID=4109 RepID=A0A9J5WY65_SOLCO|nr:hypothetical protein H5410_051358 [Solanum commersonii]